MIDKKMQAKGNNPQGEAEYLTLKEMALLASMPYAKVKRDIETGELPAYHIGRKYFIKRADAQAYLEVKKSLQAIEGYTIKEIMEIIPLSYAFIMGLIREGKLEAVKVGRQYIVPTESFEAYVEANKAKVQE